MSEMNETISFLRAYEWISLFCSECEGEFDIEEAGQLYDHEDYVIQGDKEEDRINLVCPECSYPYLEVLLKAR